MRKILIEKSGTPVCQCSGAPSYTRMSFHCLLGVDMSAIHLTCPSTAPEMVFSLKKECTTPLLTGYDTKHIHFWRISQMFYSCSRISVPHIYMCVYIEYVDFPMMWIKTQNSKWLVLSSLHKACISCILLVVVFRQFLKIFHIVGCGIL